MKSTREWVGWIVWGSSVGELRTKYAGHWALPAALFRRWLTLKHFKRLVATTQLTDCCYRRGRLLARCLRILHLPLPKTESPDERWGIFRDEWAELPAQLVTRLLLVFCS